MFSAPRTGGNDIRAMVREAARLLPVHPVVHGDAELRQVRVLGAEIELDIQRRMLTMKLVPLPGEEQSLPLRDFCVANVRRPFSLDDVEQVLERQLRIAMRKCGDGVSDQLAPGDKGVLLQAARELVDIELINRETIEALDLNADVLAIAELVPKIEFKEIDGHWYSKVWQELESLNELMLHAPNLLPLGYAGLVNNCLWGGCDILREIKYELRRAGLSRNGWRELIRLPRQIIDALIPVFPVGETIVERFAAAFSVYRIARESGPPGFADHLAQKESGSLHELPEAAVQIMAREVRERAETEITQDFFDEDFAAVCVWLRDDQPRLGGLRNLCWRGLVERARIYKAELYDQWEEEVPRNLSWESALPEHEDSGYRFVPLTSSEALREEGEAMKHCVAQYDVDCESGKSRIFSVRSVRTRRRLATIELHIDDLLIKREWFVGQVKGPRNKDVGTRLLRVAEKLAKKHSGLITFANKSG